MAPTLLVGPQHAALEQTAFARVDEIAGETLGSVLYITRNDARRSEVEDRWAETHRPLRLTAETLDAVVLDWYEATHGPVEPLRGQLNRRLAEYALDATADTPGALAGTSASAALADAFSSRFSLFDEAGVTTASELASTFADSPLDSRIADATVDAYRSYRQLTADHTADWTTTRGEQYAAVTNTDTPFAAFAPEVDVVVLSGYHEFRPVERQLLARLVDEVPVIALLARHHDGQTGVDAVASDAFEVYESLDFETERIAPTTQPATQFAAITEALYQSTPTQVPVPESLDWQELPTPERELRFVAREIRTELANGRDPDEIAVVVPDLEAYAGSVVDTFETFKIPYSSTAATQLSETFIGGLLHNLLALAEPTPRAAELTELLSNPLVELLDADRTAAVIAAARRRETVSLSGLLDALDSESTAVVDDLLTTLRVLRTGDIETATETLRRLLDEEFEIESAIEGYASGTEQATEQRAAELIEEVLASFESLAGVDSDLSPLARLTRAFDGIPIRLPQTGGSNEIEVMGMLDARMRAFERVFLVGLTSEQFPSTPDQPAFFEAMTSAHPRFDTGDEQLRGRYLFATLLANADALTITTPETDGDEAVVQSPVLDELERVTDIEPETGVDDRVGSREDLQRRIAATPDRRAAVSAAGSRGDFSAAQTKRADRGLWCAANRSTPELTDHDGLLAADTVAEIYPPVDREPYSASRIERYVECGFKFYAETVLEIDDPDPVEATPTALETGSYVHRVLEGFYTGLQDDPEPAVDPESTTVDLTDYSRDQLAARLADIAREKLRKADFAYEGPFYERWKTQLFAGLDDATTPVDAEPPHTAPERGLFATFLDTELASDGRARPHRFELPFGEGLPDSIGGPFEIERPDGSTVSLRGYIDRVDVSPDNQEPTVELYDYKTGRPPYMTQTTGGTKFQLPIYLLAADAVLDGELVDQATLSATYYQVKPPNSVRTPRGIESKFDSQAELRSFLTDVVPDWLGQVDDAIADGRFHTTLLSASEANCSYCEYRRACDVRHHRKRAFVDEARSDASAYVPLRVRDTDLAEVMADD